MTVPQIKVRVVRRPQIKVKTLVKFPANVIGEKFLTITNNAGAYTLDVDYTLLSPGPITDPTTAYAAVLDQSSGLYRIVSISSLLTSGLDADLQAIAALSTTGILVRTGTNTWALRTATGTANEITVSNGDGVAGNPTFSLPAALTFTGKTITGGAHVAISGFGIRSTGAAFDLKFASSEVLSADRTISWNVGNADRAVTLSGNLAINGGLGINPGTTGTFPIWTSGVLSGAASETIASSAAPGTPAAGNVSIWIDTTDKRLHDKNDAGVIGTTVVADTGAANNFLTAISAAGVPSKAQPSFSNISGSVAATQMPALTGDVTTSAGSVATTIAANAVTNAKMATAGAATIKGNPTNGSANVTDFTIQGLTARGAPDAANDKIPIFDNAAGTIKYVTPAQVAGASSGTVTSVATGAGLSGGPITTSGTLSTDFSFAYRNRFINGHFLLDQRKEGAALTVGAANAYGPDRWFCLRGTNVSTIQRNLTGGPTLAAGGANIPSFLRVQRTNANTGTGVILIGQAIESKNMSDLAGQPVVLSFYARKGTNYSPTSSVLSAIFSSGTVADEGAGGLSSGTWTGIASPINQNATLTTSWQRFSYTGTLSASALEAGVTFSMTPTGTAGAADYFDITGVQIEYGAAPTAFEWIPYADLVARCIRHFQKSYVDGVAVGASAALGAVNYLQAATTTVNGQTYGPGFQKFVAQMFGTPTVTVYGYSGTSGTVSNNSGVDLAAASGTVGGACAWGFYIFNNSGGTVTTNGIMFFQFTAEKEL